MSVQYTGECSVHWGMFSTLGVFSTVEDIIEYTWGVQYTGVYHEYTRGCSVHWGFHTNSVVLPMTFPHIYHDIPLVYS